MEEPSFFEKMISNLRASCKYYTGYPKDLGPSSVVHFTSEREFVQLLHQGYPVVVAFTIKCNLTKHLDKVLEEAAAEFYPHVKFMRVECPKYPGFCITRQKKEYPFIEIFHSPEQGTDHSVGQCSLGNLLSDDDVSIVINTWEKVVRLSVRKVFGGDKSKYIDSFLYIYLGDNFPIMKFQAANLGRSVDPNITKYSVQVLPFNYDLSAYGFREFFKRHNIRSPEQK